MDQAISVVIPNYNGVELFPHTLPSVFVALERTGLPYEVIVSDDCSTDHSASYLQEHFPQVKIIQNKKNSGFSVTANRGIGAAAHELVLLLNSDVKLEPDYFSPLLKYFVRPEVFGVMGRIIGWDDEKIQDGAKYPYFHGVKIKTSGNYVLSDEKDMEQGLLTMYLSGANALIRKAHFLSIGGFNELFSPFYVEDYELSLRAWRLGLSCFYEHRAICRHKTSTSIMAKAKKTAVEKIYNRNKMYLHAIHLERPERYLYFLQLGAELVFRLLSGRWSFLRAFYLFAAHYGGVRQARKKLQELSGGKKMLPVRSVAGKILDSVKDKNIIRF